MGFLGGASGSIGSVGAATANLLVLITGNNAGLDAALAKSTASLSGFNQNAGTLGGALTRSLTVPLLGLSVVSIKLASDFATAMTKITALTPFMDTFGGTAEDLQQKLFDLSSTTATSVTDLADTLYFAGSAGLNAAQALDVTEMAAKGAAMGMGSAADIARTLVAAMNTFGTQGLTAAQAMDALTVAIREGLAEPAEFAIALGRLMEPAKQAGLTFQQVTTAVSQLTNLGLPTRVATTSLRALFTALDAPTQATTEQLAKYGLTVQQVQDTLQKGVIPTVDLLSHAADGQSTALRALMPQVRGYTAFLGLAEAGTLHITGAMQKSTGAFDKAWKAFQQTPAIKFQQGLVSLQNAGIKLGAALMPVFLAITSAVQGLADWFTNLGGTLQGVVAGAIVIAALAGPLLKLYQIFVQGVVGMNNFKYALATTALAAVAAVASFDQLANGSISVTSIATVAIGSFIALRGALTAFQAAANAGALGVNTFSVALASLGAGPIGLIAVGLAGLAVAVGIAIGSMNAAKNSAMAMGDAFLEAAKSGQTMNDMLANMKDKDLKVRIQQEVPKAEMNAPVAAALPDTYSNQVADLATKLNQLSVAASNTISGDLITRLNAMQAVMAKASTSGQDMGQALQDAGFSSKEFFDTVAQAGDLGDPEAKQLAIDVKQLGLDAGFTNKAYQDYLASVKGGIAVSQQAAAAVSDTATAYGVTTDEVNAALSSNGMAATDLLDVSNRSALATAAGWIDASGKVVGAQQEMQASYQKTQEGLAEQIGLFGQLDDKVKQSTATLTKQAEAHAQFAVKSVSAMRMLAQKGVPTDLINKIASDSPAMLQKLASGTQSQLKRVTNAYKVELAATDAEILKEGKHQFVKGKDLVVQLTHGILQNDSLAPKSAQHIMAKFQQGLKSGKVKQTGMQLVKDIATSIEGARQMLGPATSKIKAQLYKDFADNPQKFNKMGEVQIAHYVDGLVSKMKGVSGKTKAAVSANIQKAIQAAKTAEAGKKAGTDTDTGFYSGLKGGGAKVKAGMAQVMAGVKQEASQGNLSPEGQAMMQSFAQGLTSGSPLVMSAIDGIISAAKAHADAAAKNSPEYFTYYMGRQFMEDMGRGMRDGAMRMGKIRSTISLSGQMGARAMADAARAMRETKGQHFKGELHITDWDKGLGMIDGRIVDQIDVHTDHNNRMERMHT